eukprot:scaffold27367_cov112-Isochrysis_galbana.AAC.5
MRKRAEARRSRPGRRVPLHWRIRHLVHGDGLLCIGDRVGELCRIIIGEADRTCAALPLQKLHRAPSLKSRLVSGVHVRHLALLRGWRPVALGLDDEWEVDQQQVEIPRGDTVLAEHLQVVLRALNRRQKAHRTGTFGG